MARAGWKYHFFRSEDITNYLNYLTDDFYEDESVYTNSRFKTITKLNYFTPLTVYTGKWLVNKNLTKHYFGIKVGQLTKTRKPFYFRSKKKKKNVRKKNPVSIWFSNFTS